MADATAVISAAWWPLAVGAKVSVTGALSPGPRSSRVVPSVKAAPFTPRRTMRSLVGVSVSVLLTVKLRLALCPSGTAANSSGAGASILSLPGVRPGGSTGTASMVTWSRPSSCPSLTVRRTVTSPALGLNMCTGFASSEVVPSPKSQW